MIVYRAQATIWDDSVQVIACHQSADGRLSHIAEPVQFVMTKREEGTLIQEPTFRLDTQEARNLMTALWEAGVRPAGYQDSRAEVRRMEAHIDDLRRIAFEPPPPTVTIDRDEMLRNMRKTAE